MPSTVVGIDTSGTWCSAALVRADGTLHVRRADVGHAHSDHVLQMIDEVLAEGEMALGDCDAIAFSAGPGSFTGLRIACAVAQGLAFGASLPVAAVGTLDAIAHSLDAIDVSEAPDAVRILVAQDARMGELYWGLFERHGEYLTAIDGPALATPERLRRSLATLVDDRPIALGCGNAWAVHGAALDGLVERVVHRAAADAADVAMLGRRAFEAGRTTDPAGALPLYVRNDVARTTAERAAAALASAAP